MKHHRPFATAPFAVFAFFVAFAAFAALPQASQAGTESRNVGEFTSIALRNNTTVLVSQGNTTSVQVKGDDELLPLLETVVDNGRLEIRWKRGESADANMKHHSPVTVTVVMPQLKGLSVAGSGDIEVSAYNTPELSVSVAGSGSARLQGLATGELGVSVAGSGDVKGSGQATSISVSIAGSGDVDLSRLQGEDVTVRIAGSGDAEVQASKKLEVNIAGSGDVIYSGDAVLSRSVMGSGTVKKR